MKRKLSKKDVLTIPNALSVFRILLIPLIVWLYLAEDRPIAAVITVGLSALTDVADGFIARRFHMISDVGKVLDPIADKLTQAALLICLTSRYRFLWWVFAFLAFKEIFQGLLGLAAVSLSGEMNQAHWYGKLSTVIFYAAMLVLLAFPGLSLRWVQLTVAVCCAALMLSLILYAHSYLTVIWGVLFPDTGRRSIKVRLLMLLLWAGVILFFWFHRDSVSVEGALQITPKSTVLAILVMLALFTLKSLSVVIYSGILYALSGILFPLPLAIGVNLAGTVLMAAMAYGIGHRVGGEAIDRVVHDHRNAALMRRLRTETTLLYTVIIRVINLLPFDLMSAYFGATGTPFVPYLLGTLGGMAVSLVLFPLIGSSVLTPASPRFFISAAVELVILLGSALTLWALRKKAVEE